MHILLIHQYFLEDDDPGGSRFNEMTRVWTDLGHEVTVLAGTMHYTGNRKRKEYRRRWVVSKKQGPVKVHRCHVSEAYNSNFLGRLWGYFSFVFSSIWAGIFHCRDTYDVILVTSPPLFVGITAVVLSWWKRRPFVFEIRDLWPESAIDTGVLTNRKLIAMAYRFEAFIYRKAHRINVLTPAFRETLITQKKVPADKIFFIPNAADFTLSDTLLHSFDAVAFRHKHHLDGHFVITYVGAHGVANHLVQVLDAAEILRDTPVLFQLIGSGMQKDLLIEDAKRRGLQNVRFVDPVPKTEVFKYILASDVGASVLKRVDTFKTIYSNKTFDYMACKKPVLLVIDGVSRDLVEAAECGVFAEPERAADIAEKVLFLMEDATRLQKMGENGYVYAKKHFDREKLAKQYLSELERIR